MLARRSLYHRSVVECVRWNGNELNTLLRVVDLMAEEWQDHARFPGISVKSLLTSSDNPFASVNVVQVPHGGEIGRHHHTHQFETIWVIRGKAILTLDQTEVPLRDGQIIATPIGLEHALRNEGPVLVELLTFFTPPFT
jgi:quercetin dioxygenase-like cupin family protein